MPTVKQDDIILLGDAIPGKHIHAVKYDREKFSIYNCYVWNDGSIQIGYASCTLTSAEFLKLGECINALQSKLANIIVESSNVLPEKTA